MARRPRRRCRPVATCPARSRVREWQTVTVASSLTSRNAAGMPTTADRPMTTASRPSISMPGPAEDLDRGVRGRGQEAVVAETQEPGVERVDAVDVLGRVDGVDDGPQPDRRRERHLDDDPVDDRVVVEGADRGRHPAPRSPRRRARRSRRRCRPSRSRAGSARGRPSTGRPCRRSRRAGRAGGRGCRGSGRRPRRRRAGSRPAIGPPSRSRAPPGAARGHALGRRGSARAARRCRRLAGLGREALHLVEQLVDAGQSSRPRTRGRRRTAG